MNNEIKLLHHIMENDGELVSNYHIISESLNCSKSTVINWTKKLIANGFIEIQSRVIHNNKRIIYTVTEKGHEKYENEKEFLK